MDYNDDRYLELLAEMVTKQDTMVYELRTLNRKADTTNDRLEKLEQQQMKTNLALGELRLSVMRLGDREHILDDVVARLLKVEEKVFH